jgi:hypothetical protein
MAMAVNDRNSNMDTFFKTVIALSAASVALSMGAIGGVAVRWHTCYNDSIEWYQQNKPSFTVQDQEAFATNFCNGGTPIKPENQNH